MNERLSVTQVQILRDYAAGRLGTRDTIERAGLEDYGDLIVALAQNDLALPEPASSPERAARLARLEAILQPLLRLGD